MTIRALATGDIPPEGRQVRQGYPARRGAVPHPSNSLYSAPNLRRGVAPVSRVIQEGVRGRTALRHRSNGRSRGRGRCRASKPPEASRTVQVALAGSPSSSPWRTSCSWRRSASPGAGNLGGVVSHKARFFLRACAWSPSWAGVEGNVPDGTPGPPAPS
jgi:hypothetical protein